MKEYSPPVHLMEKVSEEYTEYMHGRNTGGYLPWLALAVRILQPRRILELGNFYGSSTIMMYSEISEKTESFYSADIERNLAFVPDEVFTNDKMRFFFGDDLNLNIYKNRIPDKIDFLFIDTLHEKKQLQAEWKIYKHLCAPGALVVLDDIRVEKLFDFWEGIQYPKIELTEDCHPSGFGAFIYLPDRPSTNAPEDNLLKAHQAALDVFSENLTEAREELSKIRIPTLEKGVVGRITIALKIMWNIFIRSIKGR